MRKKTMRDIDDRDLDSLLDQECEFCNAVYPDEHDDDCPLAEFDDLDDSEADFEDEGLLDGEEE